LKSPKNKVLYAECGKDFVDVLFSFLTLPLGTIARLVATDSNMKAVKFGSISSLYQSVENLDQQYIYGTTPAKKCYYSLETLWKLISRR
jgi:hypothetical protein